MTTGGQLLRAARRSLDGTPHLVSRPHGVTHAYVGPLTPSGRRVPRSGRTVCRAHTRSLYVLPELPSQGSVTTVSGGPRGRVCARCSARLLPRGEAAYRAEQPASRHEWVDTYSRLTPFDLAVDAYMATTAAEVDRVEFLAVLLVGWPAIHTHPVVSPTGKTTGPLTRHLRKARGRVGGHRHDPLEAERRRAVEDEVRDQRRRDRADDWVDRNAVDRHGFRLNRPA